MWQRLTTTDLLAFARLVGVWLAPDGRELLVLTDERTEYWSLSEGRPLWSLPETGGGEGLSADGRVYRDISSGMFYPVMGRGGGRQRREHPAGGRISVHARESQLTVIDPASTSQTIPWNRTPGDWLVASFCESGSHLLIADSRALAVYGRTESDAA